MSITDQGAVCAICSHCDQVFQQRSRLNQHQKALKRKASSKPPSSSGQTQQLSPTRASCIKVLCEKEGSETRFIDITESDPTQASDSVSDDDGPVTSEITSTMSSPKPSAACFQTPNEVALNERLIHENPVEESETNRLKKIRKLNHAPGVVQPIGGNQKLDIAAGDHRTTLEVITVRVRFLLMSRHDDNVLQGMYHFQANYPDQMHAVNPSPTHPAFQGISQYNHVEFPPQYTPNLHYQTSFVRGGYEPQHENLWGISAGPLDLDFPTSSDNPDGSQDILGFHIPLEMNQEVVHSHSVGDESPNFWYEASPK
jgi:hypothetical protein